MVAMLHCLRNNDEKNVKMSNTGPSLFFLNTFNPHLIDSMETEGQLYRHICNKLKFLVCLKQQFASEKTETLESSLIMTDVTSELTLIMTDMTRECDRDCNVSVLSLLTPLERNDIFMLFRFPIYSET